MTCQWCKLGFSKTAPVVTYAGKIYHAVCIPRLKDAVERSGGTL